MILRLTGAAVRAFLVAFTIVLPTLLFKDTSFTSVEFTRILATIAAVFVIYEYGFSSASVIEFRFTSPYNRIRFILIMMMVVSTCVFLTGANFIDGPLASVVTFSDQLNALFSFRFSPVAIVTDQLGGSSELLKLAVGRAVSFNIFLALVAILMIAVLVYTDKWNMGGPEFNIWSNMPTYSASESDRLSERLRNSAFSSFLLALLMPLFGPTIVDAAIATLGENGQLSPIIMIWVISLWIYFSGMFLMRAIAITKISRNLTIDAEPVHA